MENIVSYFMEANRFFREKRPADGLLTSCEDFQMGGLLEIAVPTPRCPQDGEGGCIMCDYGVGRPITSQRGLEAQFDGFVSAMGEKLETLMLCTNGSFLDDKNVPLEIQRSFFMRAQRSLANTVIIETHLNTISLDKLRMIRECIPSKTIILEVGLESADPFVQENCYMKKIPLEILSSVMEEAYKMGFVFQLNVILGAPFLPGTEQMEDAERTIRWGLVQGALIALFPMNIKPYTLLWYAYLHGLYRPISHWMMPLLLERFVPEELEKIDLAWYGNRQLQYGKAEDVPVFPRDCDLCHGILQDFYNGYVVESNGAQRRELVRRVLSDAGKNCSCMERESKNWHPPLVSPKEYIIGIQHMLLEALRKDNLVFKEV